MFVGWVALAVGWSLGFGLAHLLGRPRDWTTWQLLIPFGMAGYLIEALRFQGGPREGSFYRAWNRAGRLRRTLFLILTASAFLLGLFGIDRLVV